MSVPERVIELLDEGRLSIRGAAKFQFGTGTYGVTTNGANIKDDDDVIYVANNLIRIDEPAETMGLDAKEFTISLPWTGESGNSPDTLGLIEAEDYKGRPVTVYDVFFDPDTRELLYFDPIAFGYIDWIDHQFEGGQLTLVAHVVSGALDNHRDGYRAANHEDQQLISEGDMGFEYAGRVRSEHFEIEL